jgi:hypothetical protein
VDAGSLTVIGPSPLNQDRTCVSGQTCVLADITGRNLASVDSFLVLDTCGEDATLPRFVTAGLVVSLQASGSLVRWVSDEVTTAGGQYRLCWCTGSTPPVSQAWQATAWSCSVSENFRTDLGELRLIGISPLYQDRTCVSGQPCTIDGITGQDLTSSDRLLVLETCGTRSSPPGLSDFGFSSQVSGSGAMFSWGIAGSSA